MNGCSQKMSGGVAILDQTLDVGNYFGNNVQVDESTSGFMTLAEAARSLPRLRGKRVHTSTIFRWCKRGVKGVFLKYGKIGRTIVVSPSDLQTFFTALAEADSADQPNTTASRKRRPRRTTSATRQREIEAANEVLIKAGILKPTDGHTEGTERRHH